MRRYIWITFYLSILIENVNSSIFRRTQQIEHEIIVKHRRKLIQTDHEDGISGSYIVHFQDDITDEEVVEKAKELATATGGIVFGIYTEIFKGFAISGLDSDDRIATILGRDDVKVMDQDIRFTVEEDVDFWPEGAELDFLQIGNEVPNGLDRIDQVGLPLNEIYSYKELGRNVTVYILDTGMAMDHVDFEGRGACGSDPITEKSDFFDLLQIPPLCDDDVNHGTPIAAIIGGKTSGVAKKANLVSVKVLGPGGGTAATVLAGLEYVRLQKIANPKKPMIVNMSLGSIYSKSINQAVDRLVDTGVTVVTAAGNRSVNACLVSPASARRAITVGASTTSFRIFENRDRRAFFSNWGRCVDIFAPGTRIRTASNRNQTRFGIFSGTSAAAPHVTGVIARYLDRDPTMTPDQIREKLLDDALKGRLMWMFQLFSPNRLLHIKRED